MKCRNTEQSDMLEVHSVTFVRMALFCGELSFTSIATVQVRVAQLRGTHRTDAQLI